MGWKKTFINKDGSIDTFDWSISSEINVGVSSIFVILLMISLFCSISPLIILLIYPWPGTRKGDLQSFIVAPILTVLWVLDLQYGLFNWFVWHQFPETYMSLTTINLIISVLCLIFYYYESQLNSLMVNNILPGWGFYLFCGVLIYLFYPRMLSVTEHFLSVAETPIWG